VTLYFNNFSSYSIPRLALKVSIKFVITTFAARRLDVSHRWECRAEILKKNSNFYIRSDFRKKIGTPVETDMHIVLKVLNRVCFHGEEAGTKFGRKSEIKRKKVATVCLRYNAYAINK